MSEFNQLEELVELDRELGTRSLPDFIEMSWNEQWSDRPYIRTWHGDAIAEHLVAVEMGHIRDLVITMPPRMGKSNTIAVFYPVWAWLNKPWLHWIFDTHSKKLALRDSRERRTLIMSNWFKLRWGRQLTLDEDQASQSQFSSKRGGRMLTTSVDSRIIGEGGERIIGDDLNDPGSVESDSVRESTEYHWDRTMSSRRNVGAARILVQQRVHMRDVAGVMLENGDCVHLNLPWEFEPAKRCFTRWTDDNGLPHVWTDPRQNQGDELCPPLADRKKIDEAKTDEYTWSAMYQQNPIPRGGGIIKEAWLEKFYDHELKPEFFDHGRLTLSLDCTFKELKSSDFVAGTVWGKKGPDLYLMPFCIHAKLSFTQTVDAVKELFRLHPEIRIKLIEDKANGSAVIDVLRKNVQGVIPYSPKDSKVARAQAVSHLFRAGNVILPSREICPWIGQFKQELTTFPFGHHDDWVDSTTQALMHFTERWDGAIEFMRRESQDAKKLVQQQQPTPGATPEAPPAEAQS